MTTKDTLDVAGASLSGRGRGGQNGPLEASDGLLLKIIAGPDPGNSAVRFVPVLPSALQLNPSAHAELLIARPSKF